MSVWLFAKFIVWFVAILGKNPRSSKWLAHCAIASTNFDITDYNSFWKIRCSTFWDQIWPWRKIGKGQPMVIIWANLVVLEHPMLHTKFRSHRPFGSREDFLMFLPYMGMAAILVIWPWPFEQTFVPPSHGDSIWSAQWFLRRCLKECGRRMTDDRRQRPTYPISSTMSLPLR